MHRFPLSAVTEDSSKTLKQDVAPLQGTHAALFPPFSHFFFSCCGYVLAPASSLLQGLSKSSFTSPLAPHILPFWGILLFQFLSLPANLPYCPLTLLPLLTNGPTVGKHSHHSLPCTGQFLPLV